MQLKIFIFLAFGLIGGALWNQYQTTGRSPLDVVSDAITVDRPITVLVGGDVNMGRQIGQKILAGDVDYPFTKISETLQEADITFVNLESQLADLGGETQSPTNEFRFAGPPEGARSLANAGIDIVSVANNHMWDYGRDRLLETLDHLDSAGVAFVGASRDTDNRWSPNIMEVGGHKIGWLATTTLLNGYERSGAAEQVAFYNQESMDDAITSLVDEVDWVLVSVHTGNEYQTTPEKETVDLMRGLIDAGADVVIGHHPHVARPIEIYNGKPIFYSLGNFAFWQPFSFETQHSFLTKLTLDRQAGLSYEVIPVKAGWQPELLADENLIDRLNKILGTEIK